MEDIIYFELNDWFAGRDFPDAEPFISWMSDYYKTPEEESKSWIRDRSIMNEWFKDNKIVAVSSIVDMSINFCISAKKEWVEENCPELLTKYTKFLRFKEEEMPVGRFGCPFMEYKEENLGLHTWYEDVKKII